MQTRDDAIEVRFLDGGHSAPTPSVRVARALGELFARASVLSRSTGEQPQLTFGSLLAAFATSDGAESQPDAVVEWIRTFAEKSGTDLVGRESMDPGELGSQQRSQRDVRSNLRRLLAAPLTRSVSARRVIDEAVEIRKQLSLELESAVQESADAAEEAGPLNPAHLFAAFLWLPNYHPDDFERMRLDVRVWQLEFSRALAEIRPAEAAFWRRLAERSPHSGAETRAKSEPAASAGRVSIQELERFELSPSARALLHAAASISTEGSDQVSSSLNLIAALLEQAHLGTTGLHGGDWFLKALGPAYDGWSTLRFRYLRPSSSARPSPRFTAEVASMLSLARDVARATSGADVIRLRHLVAAMLLYAPAEPTNAHKLLLELGCDLPRVRAAYLDEIVNWGQDDSAAWTKLLAPSAAGTPPAAVDPDGPPARPNWGLPRVVSDRVSGRVPPDRDHLDAKRPALRFAKLLCARDVEPPIALGLFGNWGTGKSFFMGLMQSYVDELTEGKGQDPAYVRRAAQIDFNAWHYQDTNLWASLALRIFDGLATALVPAKAQPSELQKKKTELNQKLESSTQRKAEASTQRETALTRRAEKTRLLEQKLAARERTALEQLQNAWRVAKKASWFEGAVRELEDAAKALGLAPQVRNVKDVLKLREELRTVSRKGQAVVVAVGTRFELKNLPTTLLAIALIALGSVGLGGLVTLAERSAVVGGAIPGAAIWAQLTAVTSAVVGWASRQAGKARQGVELAARLEQQLRETAQELETGNGATKEDLEEAKRLRTEIGQLESEIRSATEEVSEAERQIAAATAEIERIDSGGLVYDFLREREASTHYQGQLGLVSMLRRDLLDLGRRLSELPTGRTGRIERIILYIDDLDRCQPAKVVEVLQAVHLLLAFPYFHVVVGVDARWLRRSLEEAYDRAAGKPPALGDGEFSAHDYLEKIFQIPYALAPLQKPGFEKLIDGMLKSRTEWARDQIRKQEQDRARHDAADRATRRDSSPATELEKAAGVSKPAGGAPDLSPESMPRADAEPTSASTAVDTDDTHETPPLSSATPVIFFEDHEEAFIKALYEFIDRPRLAGRFVNIYRLLRARAADDQKDDGFANTAEAVDYRVALLLLAVNVGHPRAASYFFGALRSTTSSSWSDFLQSELRRHGPSGALTPAHRRLFDQLSRLQVDAPQNLDDYRRWVEPIVCFSFDLPSSLLVAASPA